MVFTKYFITCVYDYLFIFNFIILLYIYTNGHNKDTRKDI